MMNFKRLWLIAALGLLLPLTRPVYAADVDTNEKSKHDPSLEFIFQKNTDGSRSLICNLGVTINRKFYPLKNVVLNFYTGNDLDMSLGSTITNFKGKAICTVPAKYNLPVNEEGKFNFMVEYPGNDTIEGSSEEMQVADAFMEMTCEEVDSIKTVTVKMFRQEKGENIPLKDETVSLYVPRMFSLLKLAEAKLDSAGIATFEFPGDLPGDSVGNINVLVRLEEHSDFGNIEKMQTMKWGIASTRELLMESRALWTEVAPVWMIVTLTVMLIGVWAHYLYVVIQMLVINNKGKDYKEIK